MANKQVGIEINVSQKGNKVDDLNNKIKSIENTLQGISKIEMFKDINTKVEAVNKISNSINKLSIENKTKLGSLFNMAKLTGYVYGLRRLFSGMKQVTQATSDLVENLNLTEVAYYGNTEKVKELYTQMSNVYNLNESTIIRRLGIFKQMANAMDLPIQAGEELSNLMNKMTLDISSLYNISIDRASNALQSSLVGQVRPIRGATGADVTENTLQKTVAQVVPEKYIRDLSFTEKRLIMIISLTDQLKNSQGDWARTITLFKKSIKSTKRLYKYIKLIYNYIKEMIVCILFINVQIKKQKCHI